MKRDGHALSPWHIESNVPVPDTKNASYPFAEMKVGESVFFENMDGHQRHRVSSAAYAVGNRKKWKFSCRTVDGGLRIWRVA